MAIDRVAPDHVLASLTQSRQALESNNADANIGSETTNSTLASLQSQLSLAVLAQRNTQSAAVLTLFGL
jgi:flagellin-like hook-associated protein FlgL